MIYIIQANKYKFNKFIDFLIPLFSKNCTYKHLHYIYYTLCVPRILDAFVQYDFIFGYLILALMSSTGA
jgi:hypothetical protein